MLLNIFIYICVCVKKFKKVKLKNINLKHIIILKHILLKHVFTLKINTYTQVLESVLLCYYVFGLPITH